MKEILIPSSKSISNRVLVLSALSNQPTIITNLLDCDDSFVLKKALENFGVKFENLSNGDLKVIPPKLLQGNGSNNFIKNAGTSARFLTAMSLIVEGEFSLCGIDRMHQRPFKNLFEVISKLGIKIKYLQEKFYLPAKFKKESKLSFSENVIKLSGKISSQFLSGLLLVAPKITNGLEIHITDEIKSRPYVEMTINLLKIWNIDIQISHDFKKFKVFSGLKSPQKFTVPADCSSASYPIAYSILSGKQIVIKNFGKKTFQGDEKFLEIAKRFGAEVTRNDNELKITPPAIIHSLGICDFKDMPDISMTAMLISIFADGISEFHGLESLRVKECDRIMAMEDGLQKIGAQITVNKDVIRIIGKPDLINKNVDKNIEINSFEDHRIAMVFGVLKKVGKWDFKISNSECVAKSWPEFWLDLADWSGELRQVSAIILEKEDEKESKFLIVKKPRRYHAWQFPQGGKSNGENPLETAERELHEECGRSLQVKFLNNKPLGEYKYFFPKDFKRHIPEIKGASVKFFKARFERGEIELQPEELEDFTWITKEEFKNYFEDDYLDAVLKFF